MLDWQSLRFGRHSGRRNSPVSALGPVALTALEERVVPANVLTSHNDISGTGANLAEATLSAANVRTGSFGKLFAAQVDGQVYAQPLVWNGVPAAFRSQPAAADVVFVATEHDTVYAVAAAGPLAGTTLWTRSFLGVQNLNGRVNNPEGATAISTLTSADVRTADITPEVGITGTPVLDAQTATLYVVVKTKAVIGGVTHVIQRLHALNTADGSDRTAPYRIGDTTEDNNGNPTDRTAIFVYGTGDGNYPDTYNQTNRRVVTFNALRQNQRSALRLVNGEVFVAWASHGDQGPYHGWVVKFDVSDVSRGIRLAGVLNTSPNNGQSGIWQSGGGLSFEPDGSAFYFETGNGTGGTPTAGADGFPVNGNYSEAVVKVLPDPASGPANQNVNGWGFRVADYFVPYNMEDLDRADGDFGSGAPLVLPAAAGIPGHPKLMVAAGKEGKIYLLDRDDLGKFSAAADNVVSVTPVKFLNAVFSSPVWYNSALYYVGGFGGKAKRITISPAGQLAVASETPTPSFGNLTGSPSVSANGATGGIAWIPDRETNALHAYAADSLATELWNSNQSPADNIGAPVNKFAMPTVADGQVYVGTGNSLVVYGLKPPVNALPLAPTGLAAVALSGTSVQLTWADATPAPNTATGYAIEQSADGVTFTPATTVPPGAAQSVVGGLRPLTRYYFRVRGFNGLGNSPFSAAATQTTSAQIAVVDFSAGFAGSAGALTYNGNAAVSGTAARVTDGSAGKAGSVFTSQTVDVSRFAVQFTMRQTGRGDGMTFAIQANSPTALGQKGGSLGYGAPAGQTGGIPNSAAVKLDIFGATGELATSAGLYTNGAYPGNAGATDLGAAGVLLNSGNVIRVAMAYDGATLSVTITDTATSRSYTKTYSLDLPAVLGTRNAYVGFTGATGALTAVQDVLTWTFSPNAAQAPTAPAALGSTPAAATAVALNWTNTAANQTGFQLDRAADAAFTQNLLTQNLPASPAAVTDTAPGLAPGGTFYYRIRATNTAGPSAYSNATAVTIPLAPARASAPLVAGVSAAAIDLQWTDNAGVTAAGYRILRAVDRGLFAEYVTLPPFTHAGPNLYEWSDTGVSAGHFYQYHIIAFNVSGYNDFVGAQADTPPAVQPPAAPTALVSAVASASSALLSWVNNAANQTGFELDRAADAAFTQNLVTQVLPAGPTAYTDTGAGGTYYYRVRATNSAGPSAYSNTATATLPLPPAVDYAGGFAGSAEALTYNGNAAVTGAAARITDGTTGKTGSVFTSQAVDVTRFRTEFTLRQTGVAEGVTFTVQASSPTALGRGGVGLGFGSDGAGKRGIDKSAAVKFDLFNNAGEGTSSTGLYLNAAFPSYVRSVDLNAAGIALNAGNVTRVVMTYDGTTLTVTITDTATGRAATQAYALNLAAVLGTTAAYVGFTGATGALNAAVQDVLSWTFGPAAA